MDPLSIAASALTLIHVTGIVATTLGRFARSVQTADTDVQGLYDELNSLNLVLEALRGTFRQCQVYSPELLGDGLWRHSDSIMESCRCTLGDLNNLISSIKRPCRFSPYAWRLRVALNLHMHSNKLITYREKIQFFGSSLRTVLHTITVTLSLRTSACQHLILQELHSLGASTHSCSTLHQRSVNADNYKERPCGYSRSFSSLRSYTSVSLSNLTDASTCMEDAEPQQNAVMEFSGTKESLSQSVKALSPHRTTGFFDAKSPLDPILISTSQGQNRLEWESRRPGFFFEASWSQHKLPPGMGPLGL